MWLKLLCLCDYVTEAYIYSTEYVSKMYIYALCDWSHLYLCDWSFFIYATDYVTEAVFIYATGFVT